MDNDSRRAFHELYLAIGGLTDAVRAVALAAVADGHPAWEMLAQQFDEIDRLRRNLGNVISEP
jgi:hypothetical protein